MNEITKIHLGRQPFTIAVDAHKLLQTYLAAITHQVGAKAADVVEEVELRMAELLIERGITDNKVVLAGDIEFLKAQLGKPDDFKEDGGNNEDTAEESDMSGPKRLYRDTEHGMLAGVAAGLANYTDIPVIVFRVAFIVFTFSGGVGILIYLLLWLLTPVATSPSDYLQMKGRAVTVDNLKAAIDRADVPGAAQRASRIVGRGWSRVFQFIAGGLGIGFIVASIGLLAAGATATSYLLGHGLDLGETAIFPVGTREVAAVLCGLAAFVLMAFMLALAGRAILSRKWTFPVWAFAAIVAGFVTAVSVGTALGLASAPSVKQRYNNLQHIERRTLPDFQTVDVQGRNALVSFMPGTVYSVELRSVGKVNTKRITTQVVNDELQINLQPLLENNKTPCSILCPFGSDNVQIIVHAPPSVHDRIQAPPYLP